MRTVWLSACLLSSWSAFGGCVMPSSTGSDAGAGAKIDGSTSPSGTITGTGCWTDPMTGVTLCAGTSECPGIIVNSSVFPECGFYISGTALDLECLCATYLCPMGAAPTCATAASILAGTDEGNVCAEINDNGCAQLTVSGSGGTGGSGGSGGSGGMDAGSCTMACQSMCAGEPDCLEACGC
jgi:hypothetical protein